MPDILYAPWRLDYIKNVADGPKGCFLCAAATAPEDDAKNHVITRGTHAFLMVNRYPYVNGHLLAAPYRHAADMLDLSADERAEMVELLVHGEKLLRRTVNPQGFNLGINLGKCAGAGVPDHIHSHIVPRWNGDTNFMAAVANIRVIPQSVEETFKMLLKAQAAGV
jgi:ATP adenylyltransferase